MSRFPFPIDPQLTSIAIAYRNRALIADSVLPRSPVGKVEFKWYQYAKEERFSVPETLVGRKSVPNEVEFGMVEKTSSTRDYGLEDPIPNEDVDNAPEGHDPREQATEAMQDLIALGREKRVADMVFNAANYPSGNKVTLGTPWTTTDSTDPIEDVLTALDTPIARPNVLVFGQSAWRTLSTHPKIAKATNGNAGDSAIARRNQIAELFEVDEILVGRGRLNTATKGQTPAFAQVWGDKVAAIHRNPAANVRGGVTFGLTFQYGDRVAGSWEDRNIGLRGGTRVRTGESLVEEMIAADVGYLIEGVSA